VIELPPGLPRRPGRMAVLARPKHDALVEELAERLEPGSLHRLDVRQPLRRLHVELAALAGVDCLVDLAVDGAERRLDALLPHVRPGGAYATRTRAAGVSSLVVHPPAEDAVAIVREEDVEALLEARPGLGRVLAERPGARWRSRAVVRTSGPLDLNPMPEEYDAPRLLLREWAEVVALPRQVVLGDRLVLPESFSTADGHRQVNPTVDKVSPRFARPMPLADPPPRLEGVFVHLENVMPRHFGHALSEQVAHFWAWAATRAVHPEARALVFDPTGSLAPWQVELLEAAGIGAGDVHVATGPVRVDRLVGSTPMFSRPGYAHPDLVATYDAVGSALAARAAPADRPRKVFLTRAPVKRVCRNAAQVEAEFAGAGYEVVRPESLPLPEQVALVRGADSVAGFAGSGMFHVALAGGPKHVVVVTSENYPCHNEYLMSALLGHRLDLVVCRPDVPRPGATFSRESFHSDFVFDPEREGAFLAGVLAE
jgi:capsular polysaccharide biosynthesis protein